MKKVTLTVPWGQYDLIVKKQNINTVYYNVLFPHIIFHNTGLYSNVDSRHYFVLGTFEYIEADREISRKCVTKCIQYPTTRHV